MLPRAPEQLIGRYKFFIDLTLIPSCQSLQMVSDKDSNNSSNTISMWFYPQQSYESQAVHQMAIR